MRSGFLGRGIGPVAIGGGSSAPAGPVPVAGAELVVNGDFSSATGWTPGAGCTIADGVATCTSTAPYQSLGIKTAIGDWVLTSHTRVSGAAARITVRNSNPNVYATTSTGRCNTSDNNLYVNTGGSFPAVVDNASCKLLTLSSLISTRPYASADCDISVAVTRTSGTQAGLVARLDSATAPANFIIAYLDGASNVKVDKCVAGTYTNVISGAVTYGAGRVLRLVCSGNDVSCYYNGTQVGSTTAVADAGIVSNVRHGLFSTYAANTFADYIAA